jgi:uncharacterized membrane protein
MYFWNIKALKNDIKENNFKDKEAFPYILMTIGFYLVAIEMMTFDIYYLENIWDKILIVIDILVPIVGMIYAYKKNGGEDGVNFANNYFAISFVMTIKFLLYIIPMIILLVFLGYESTSTTAIEVMVLTGVQILLYFYIVKHIKDVAR